MHCKFYIAKVSRQSSQLSNVKGSMGEEPSVWSFCSLQISILKFCYFNKMIAGKRASCVNYPGKTCLNLVAK